MNKFLLVVIVVALGFGFFWYKNDSKEKGGVEIAQVVSKPDIASGTFDFEGEDIELVDGRATTKISPESAITIETILTDKVEYGDINGDKKNDAVGLVVQEGGGSGTFIYLIAYTSGNVEYKGSNAVFVGDRISPESLSISDSGVITVKYLDRLPDEPMAADPSVSTTKTFKFLRGTLEER